MQMHHVYLRTYELFKASSLLKSPNSPYRLLMTTPPHLLYAHPSSPSRRTLALIETSGSCSGATPSMAPPAMR
eukprot:4923730-Pleurochrysis_carterae.AAC.2